MQDVMEMVLLFIGMSVIVFFHEGGHFIVSKWVGFTCEEFQVGVGPKLWKKEYKGTKFSLHLIPLGGVCTIKEFAERMENKSSENVRGFHLRKIALLLGGPLMNFILAFLLMVCAFGNTEGLMVTEVRDSQLNNVAIVEGDIIRSINGERVFNIEDINELLVSGMENTITFLNTDYEKETVSFYCNKASLDISFDESFGNKVQGAMRTFGKYAEFLTEEVSDLFTGDSSVITEPMNPYSAVDNKRDVPQSISRSINKFVMITSIFAFCLGVLNLLPIIIFDGFKVLVSLVSVIINKELSNKLNIIIAIIGIAVSILILF